MFPSLHVSLFCPSLSVKKEGVERRGEGREEQGECVLSSLSSLPLSGLCFGSVA